MFQRYVATKLVSALHRSPIVYVHGARQCGKSTLVQTLSTHDRQRAKGVSTYYEYISFDDEATLEYATVDPVGFVEQLPEFVILDEVQLAPNIFRAIKSTVDKNRKSGRFVLTGSAKASLLGDLAGAFVGRLALVRMHPLAQCECLSSVDRIELSSHYRGILSKLSGGGSLQQNNRLVPLGRSLAESIECGGYPEAFKHEGHQKRNWYLDYVNTIIERDIREFTAARRLDAIPSLLKAAATQSGTLFNLEQLGSPLEISRPTLQSFITILERLFFVEYIPAWSSNRLSRLIKSPKLYLADTGLACALLRLGASALWESRSIFGRLVETLVFHELQRQLSWMAEPPTLYHYRDKDQVEVDFVLELEDHSIAGIEVKSARTVSEEDFRGLRKLASVAPKFNVGVVLYDGEWTIQFEERMYAIPIRRLFEEEID